MIPADRIVKGALDAAVAAYTADEDLFRTVLYGFPSDELDRLWAAWNSEEAAPSVRLGYAREKFRVPRWQVTLNDSMLLAEPARLRGRVDRDNERKWMHREYAEVVQVSVLARSPDEAMWHFQLVRGGLGIMHRAILATTGVSAIHFVTARDLAPIPPGEINPAHVYSRVSLWRLHANENLPETTPTDGSSFITGVSVVQADYQDASDIDGGVTPSEG